MKFSRILTQLYAQPLFCEQHAWDSFNLHAATLSPAPAPSPAHAPAHLCSACDGTSDPVARFMRVLKFARLAADDAPVFSADDDAASSIRLVPSDTAIITISGLIVKHADEWECEFLGLTDLDDVDAAIAHVAADANIVNVLFIFENCPGGSSIGVAETAARVYALAQSKNVYTYSDSFIASAGIYIGSQATQFFVTESTYSGSIGVIRPPIIDVSKMLTAQGISTTTIKSGKFKDTGTQLRPPTEEEIAMLNKQSARQMLGFTSAVKRGRPAMRAESMEGQIFIGSEAVEVGLADAVVSSLEEVLQQF